MKSAVVIGRSGQVGKGLVDHLSREGYQVIATSSKGEPYQLDLGHKESIDQCLQKIRRELPEGKVSVFLAGALTHVDLCEEKPDFCRQMNALGPIQVAEICKKYDWALTFYSSEYVFGAAEHRGEAAGPYSEEDPPEPCCEYGKAKLEAEIGILNVLPSAQIIRTVMVYSWDPKGMNFFMQYLRHLENFSKNSSEVFRIPEDQISTPTYGPALSAASVDLAKTERSGVFNLVGPDLVSRKELVYQVAESCGFSKDQVEKAFQFVKTKDLQQKAKRPLRAGLKTEKADALGIRLPSLAKAFQDIQRRRLENSI